MFIFQKNLCSLRFKRFAVKILKGEITHEIKLLVKKLNALQALCYRGKINGSKLTSIDTSNGVTSLNINLLL
jgi:hypothetical protein